MAHREPTDWVNRTLETDTCWKEVSFRKGKVSKGWLFAAFVLSWQSPFSWEEGTESLLCPQEGILHYVCRKCGLLRISALNTCGSTSAFLEVWGIEEDGRDGFIGTRSPSCFREILKILRLRLLLRALVGNGKSLPSSSRALPGIRATMWLIFPEIFLIASLTWATVNFS